MYFQPKINLTLDLKLTPIKSSIESVKRYVEKRNEEFMKKQDKMIKAECKIGSGKNWINKKTIPRPFKFHISNHLKFLTNSIVKENKNEVESAHN